MSLLLGFAIGLLTGAGGVLYVAIEAGPKVAARVVESAASELADRDDDAVRSWLRGEDTDGGS